MSSPVYRFFEWLDARLEPVRERAPRVPVPEPVRQRWQQGGRLWRRLGPLRYLVAAGLMALIPPLMERGWFPILNGTYGQTVLFNTGYWILLTLGLGVVVGLAGLLDLGYVAFFLLGSYTTALMTHSGAPGQFHFVEWPTWAALPFALIVAMVAGVAIGLPTLRLRGDYLAIVTLGFHEIMLEVMNNLGITNGPRGIPAIPTPSISIGSFHYDFGLNPAPYWWFLLIPAIILAVIMVQRLDGSRVGRYWTAIREDEVAASAMGVPIVKMKVLAFVIGASTSGIAGWIYATNVTFIDPTSFPLLLSVLVLCSVVIGGLGSIGGAVLGAILVQAVPEAVRQLSGGNTLFGFDPLTGRIAIFGAVLIIVMIYRPGGLLAARRRRTEMVTPGPESGVVVDDASATEQEVAPADDVHSAGGRST